MMILDPEEKILLSKRSDEELAELCRKQDHAAFQELMTRYMNQIYNFIRQYTKTNEDTDDITQDTFLKVWKNIRHYSPGRLFRPWLFTIARNTALDYLKKKRSMVFSDLDNEENDLSFADTLHDPEPLPPEVFENAELAKQLNGILTTLSPDYRAVLTLHYQDCMTFDEIAEIMNKPMNTVKSWHHRALIQLRDRLVKT